MSNLQTGVWETIQAADEEAERQTKRQAMEDTVARRRASLRSKKSVGRDCDTPPAKKRKQVRRKRTGQLKAHSVK